MSQALSRRNFLQGAAAAVVMAGASSAPAQGFGSSRFVYVGTYTAGSGNGEGIYLYQVNAFTGELTLVKLAAAVPDPSFVLASPSGKYLYCTNEISNFQGSTSGSVTAFSVDRSNGELTLLNTVSSLGGGPVYLSLDQTGMYLFVANYGGGSNAVFPVNADGSLSAAVDT
ncbi:MAG: beta-propeller fold lactonase family protein, partial [Acidobacteriaceae bacterium]